MIEVIFLMQYILKKSNSIEINLNSMHGPFKRVMLATLRGVNACQKRKHQTNSMIKPKWYISIFHF